MGWQIRLDEEMEVDVVGGGGFVGVDIKVVKYNIQEIVDKLIVDSMEVFIGVYLILCGYFGVLCFMKFFGIKVFFKNFDDYDFGRYVENCKVGCYVRFWFCGLDEIEV